jgi:DNA-binding NarL/FixJ family response regulator
MIRLAIIEDNTHYRTALELFVATAPDLSVVYSDRSVAGLLAAPELEPAVVIMDIDLGAESGIDGIPLLKKAFPAAAIFMLTVFEDEDKIYRSIQAGALGYLLKKEPPEAILEAIRRVHAGEGVMNGAVTRKILNRLSQPPPEPDLDQYQLTRREKEILSQLILGHSYKVIAANCFISIDTLNSHIRKLYSKLQVHSRSEIAARFRAQQS